MSLPRYLRQAQERILRHALDFGLQPFDTIFELVNYERMNEVAAYLGFPVRYPHWRFGMEYERQAKGYAWGLHKIYELVINNDPCYAYLLEGNSLVEQKMVMAHVYGHSDFFRNNAWFAHTPRNMINEMANHAVRIERLVDRYGLSTVEKFLDVCLSIDNLIDYHSPFIRRRPAERDEDDEPKVVHKLPVERDYLDEYVNPPDFIEKQREEIRREEERAERFPPEPERDVVLFLLEHAPLKRWQHDILSMVREEAYYFAPQGQTKIMNEGWASFWHSRIMTQRALEPSELIDFAATHAGTMATAPGQLNPYKLGIELFRDIEDRWNRGAFGKDYEECTDFEARVRWNRHLGLGLKKIFEVRRIHNDVSFIDEFLTPEFCWEHKLFTYEYDQRAGQFRIFSRKFPDIKQKLLQQLTNFGQPIIYVEDANFRNRGELLLWHQHEGVDLRKDYAREVLSNLQRLWRRPVHIRTIVGEGKRRVWSHDGEEFSEDTWSPEQ